MNAAPRDARALFAGALVLAPMTKGSNTPFRRLCRELGADVTVGEMALALHVVKRRRSELALLRAHPGDHPFGAQLADRDPASLAEAGRVAEELGSDFVDLNCGCPIDPMVRRGIGAALLRSPGKIGRLVAALKAAVTIPVTVKIRLGWSDGKRNHLAVAKAAADAGADALFVHARTREQRYARAADWQAVGELKEALRIPVIGNGDLLCHWEVERKWREAGCDAVMMARGALVKPWIFREVKERREIVLSAEQRLDLLRRYVALALEHFGDDDHGRKRIREFLTWHLAFLCRWRPLPRDRYDAPDFAHPLLQTRLPKVDATTGLDALLARDDRAAHDHVAAIALGERDPDDPAPEPDTTDERVLETSNG